MDPISIAVGLAQFAPQVVRWITGNDAAGAAVEKVVDVARAVTGATTGESALAAIRANPDMAMQFQQAVMANETELERLYLADVQSARLRDQTMQAAGVRNYRADAMFGLALAIVGWMVYLIWSSPSLDEYVKGVFTLLIGRFLGYLDVIYQFEFGSTRSNKSKDASIESLTRGRR